MLQPFAKTTYLSSNRSETRVASLLLPNLTDVFVDKVLTLLATF